MPPRYAYWTILIDGKATAFRAHEREELLPTFNQLARKNSDIVMRYFARGRLWDNPEQAQWANRNRDARPAEQRDRSWRPGGQHKDPRARFSERTAGAGSAGKPAAPWKPEKSSEARPRPLPTEASKGSRDAKAGASEGASLGGAGRGFGHRPPGSHRKPFDRDQKPFNPEERNTRFEGRPKDRRPPKFGAPPGKRGGRWNRPPKRDKPR